MYLNLTICELCYLHGALELLIEESESLSLSCEFEKELLKKIYSLSPLSDRKYPELIK